MFAKHFPISCIKRPAERFACNFVNVVVSKKQNYTLTMQTVKKFDGVSLRLDSIAAVVRQTSRQTDETISRCACISMLTRDNDNFSK